MSDFWACDIHERYGEGDFNCYLCGLDAMFAWSRLYENIITANLVVNKPMIYGRLNTQV
jgi:hypothetical protein